jgi:hypothetical protein
MTLIGGQLVLGMIERIDAMTAVQTMKLQFGCTIVEKWTSSERETTASC